MKSVTYVLAAILCGLTVSASAQASVQANSVDHKFYAGITLGPTYPSYAVGNRDISVSSGTRNNIGLLVGKGFGSLDLEFSMMIVNYEIYKYTRSEPYYGQDFWHSGEKVSIDNMFALDAHYNFFRDGNFTCKAIAGAALIKSSTVDNISSTSVKDYSAKLAPKLGAGAKYVINNFFAVTGSINYVKPIDHAYLSNLVYANVGMNVYF